MHGQCDIDAEKRAFIHQIFFILGRTKKKRSRLMIAEQGDHVRRELSSLGPILFSFSLYQIDFSSETIYTDPCRPQSALIPLSS